MKKHYLIFSAAAALILSGCSSSTKSSDADSSAPAVSSDSTQAPDSAALPTVQNIPFEVKKMEKKKGENELEIEYPVNGNPALVESVRKWINERLGDSYKGDMNNADAFFRHYASKLGSEEFDEFGGYTIDSFDLEFTNDYIVTYEYASYQYEGGAHGDGGEYGTTFLQSSGEIFSKKCFTSYKDLHNLFIEGLKRYFNVKTDKELADNLNISGSLSSLAPPAMEPWIEKDGVAFSYTPYEIAPFAAGCPHFTIPYSQIEPYLTDEGKAFFGK